MNKKSKEEIEKAMKNAKASMEISGFTLTPEHEELVRKKLMGEITEEEFLEKARAEALKKK